jgi:hypothetical protein
MKFSAVVSFLVTGVLIGRAVAQTPEAVPVAADKNTPGASARLLEDVRGQIFKGRAQFDSNQPAAQETLRDAAQKSLEALVSYLGPQVLSTSPDDFPQAGFMAAAVRQGAEAYYWWGRAADQFGQRDQAITAYARAVRFSAGARSGGDLGRDSLLALGGALRDGLPLIAPDDVLEIIAKIAHGGLWAPRRFTADFSGIRFNPLGAGESPLSLDAGAGQREFLVTSGRLYPPVPSSAVDASAVMSRVPPLYRTVRADALPDVLKLDRMTLGYEHEVAGTNKGLWRQVVRVFYPSTYLTRNHRDDRPRAEALCLQFLKVHAMVQSGLGLENMWARDDVTTLWLSEVSSWWPRDDDDPRVREAIGSQMPKVNTPTKGQTLPAEIETPATSIPWNAAGQTDSAPGEIMFFKMTAPRDEAEWLRETMHEYGHAVLPPLDGFKPPLEPYSNGLLGETLGELWAAAAPQQWNVPAELGLSPASSESLSRAVALARDVALAAALHEHVNRNALAALKFWRAKGPASPLRRDSGAAGLQYLQGLATYIERVYGAEVLGHASTPLIAKVVGTTDPLARLATLNTDSLLASFPSVLRDAFGSSAKGAEVRIVVGESATRKVLPIWLGGALGAPTQTADDLIARAPLKLKAGERASGWFYIPPAASTLRLEWQSATRSADAVQIAGGKLAPIAPLEVGATGAAALDVKARSGWQQLTFVAHADVTLLAAQFEK